MITHGGAATFDAVATGYDRMNRLLSLGRDAVWRRALVRALAPTTPPARILDIATGTGDVAAELRHTYPESEITGLDVSTNMLVQAGIKLAGTGVRLVQGDALALPFPNASFDAACVAFGLRNMPDRERALAEMRRVVRPQGVVAILELTEPRGILAPLTRLYVHHIVPKLGVLSSAAEAYAYLARSIAAFPPPEAVVELMGKVGLVEVTARSLTFGVVHLFVGRCV